MDANWVEHRRPGDRELLGWIRPEGEDFVVIDLLGRERSEAVDWLSAEELLEGLGIGYLADPYEMLLDSGEWRAVRLQEVSSEGIRLKNDDWSAQAVGAPQLFFELPFPVPEGRLRRR